MSAHIARRHSNLAEPAPSPVHEQYRVETEKLHDEIKTLKERLNRTERVIGNESDKASECGRTDKSYKPNTYEKGEYTSALEKEREERLKEQQIKYEDEIASLKNMLFTEIRVSLTYDNCRNDLLSFLIYLKNNLFFFSEIEAKREERESCLPC